MKNVSLSIGFSLLLFLLGGNVSAQLSGKSEKNSTDANPQSVTNHAINNPDVLVVTGRIVDATTNQAINNAHINFDKFGDELIQASIDANGNYALALNKKELGEPVRVIFKIEGYKKFVIKNLDKQATFVDVNVFLQPVDSEEKSKAQVKYIMSDDPFNPLVIKMQ